MNKGLMADEIHASRPTGGLKREFGKEHRFAAWT